MERPSDAGEIPDTFVPVEAVVCGLGVRARADGAVVRVGLERRADDIAALLTYLARPSEVSSNPDDLACRAIAAERVWLFLTDADGRWVTPTVPTDACGLPLDFSREPGPAYQQLRFRDRVVRQLGVLESAEARASGCSMAWKNMVAVEAAGETRRAPIRTDPFGGAAVRVCRYAVPEEERSSSTPVGNLLGGQVLDRRQRAALLDSLVGSRAATDGCDEPAGRFAVLNPTGAGQTLYLELDGCQRILHPAAVPSLARADPELVRLVEALSR